MNNLQLWAMKVKDVPEALANTDVEVVVDAVITGILIYVAGIIVLSIIGIAVGYWVYKRWLSW